MANLDQAISTMRANEEALFTNPNVSHISVAQTAEGGDDYSLVIGLIDNQVEVDTETNADAEFAAIMEDFQLDLIPAQLKIADEDGIEIQDAEPMDVTTEVTGEISALSFTDRRRPAHGGNSCGNPRRNSAGTLGAAVNYQGAVHILSNWHVIYGPGGSDGDPIIQPGRLDGGRLQTDVIARNVKGWLDQYRDMAIAKVRSPWQSFVADGSRCYGKFGQPKSASVNMSVKKCGRSTRATTGFVRSINSTVRVSGYPGGARIFRDQIMTSGMSAPGDSGSIVCETQTNSPVGLLFAGSSSVTFANKIERVLGTLLAADEKAKDFLADVDFNLDG